MFPILCWFTLSVVLFDILDSYKLFRFGKLTRAGGDGTVVVNIPSNSKVTITIERG